MRPFNRTNVELKRAIGLPWVPNRTAFNRTNVELKHHYQTFIFMVTPLSFNRTNVELKHLCSIPREGTPARF